VKIVTIIPARGGSKGIPRKNLIDVCGKPLIQYAIEASKKSQVDETWVSSDDDEILSVASELGAFPLKRPAKLATDMATSESALLHFAENVDFDVLIFIQATSPLITADDINRSISALKKYDSVVAVTQNSQLFWEGNSPLYDLSSRKRRQDSADSYLEVGSLFATTRCNLLKSRNRLSGKLYLLKVPKKRAFDIDSYEDLELVKILINSGVLDTNE